MLHLLLPASQLPQRLLQLPLTGSHAGSCSSGISCNAFLLLLLLLLLLHLLLLRAVPARSPYLPLGASFSLSFTSSFTCKATEQEGSSI
jgi:hypothetical protein